MRQVKFMYNGIKIDGKLYKGRYSRGHRDDESSTVTFYSAGYESLPKDLGFTVQNDTDVMTDYFEKDKVDFSIAHEKHKEAVAAWLSQELKEAQRTINKYERKEAIGKPLDRFENNSLMNARERIKQLEHQNY